MTDNKEPEGLYEIKKKMAELLDEIPGVEVSGSGCMMDGSVADVSFLYGGSRYVALFQESNWKA